MLHSPSLQLLLRSRPPTAALTQGTDVQQDSRLTHFPKSNGCVVRNERERNHPAYQNVHPASQGHCNELRQLGGQDGSMRHASRENERYWGGGQFNPQKLKLTQCKAGLLPSVGTAHSISQSVPALTNKLVILCYTNSGLLTEFFPSRRQRAVVQRTSFPVTLLRPIKPVPCPASHVSSTTFPHTIAFQHASPPSRHIKPSAVS